MPLIEELPVTNPIKASHGWAYVPETSTSFPIAAQQPGTRDRKRAAATTTRHAATSTAKREKAIQARLDSLNKENHRDVTIPIPARKADGKKQTSNVRRVLASQRTFAHYLAEEEALHPGALHYTLPTIATGMGMGPPATTTSTKKGRQSVSVAETQPATPVMTQRGTKRSRQASRSQSISKTVDESAAISTVDDAEIKTEEPLQESPANPDVSMSDAPAPVAPEYPPEWDSDPLLTSTPQSVPPMPSDRVMQLLVSEPPLTYSAARAKPLDEEKRPPPRKFCGVCGYWGRVKCRKCEDYTCGIMDCWRDHERICVNANAY